MAEIAQAATPMMRQYLETKARFPDAILFFRLGDFYEMFFEDAVVGARLLDLTLTTRVTSRRTSAALPGSPSWSQMATLNPFSSSFAT